MGCDIHPHLEYYTIDPIDNRWTNCFAAYGDMGRNYTLFNALAGVRGMGDCPVAPRGLPDPNTLSFQVFNSFYEKIVDVVPSDRVFDFGSLISREDADKLMQDYKLQEIEHAGDKYIPNVNWHTPSYLFLNEMIEVRRKYLLDIIEFDNIYRGKKRREVIKTISCSDNFDLMKFCFPELECPCLNAIVASMIAIENSGAYKSRFVFWFDS